MFRKKNVTYICWVGGIFLLFAFPKILSESWTAVVSEMLIMALAGTSLNILVGYCGVVSFGHAGFFAIGAYSYSLLMIYNVFPFTLSLIAAPVLSGVFALICGYFSVKMVKVYFALLVLAFSQIVYVVIINWYDVTRGDDGLSGFRSPGWLLSQSNCYWFILVVVLACLVVIRIITLSSFGGAIKAMRENRERVEIIGVDSKKYLLIAFIISGVFTGMAGGLMSVFMTSAFPSFASFFKSGEFLLVCLMGGVNTFLGPSVGAAVYIFLDKFLSTYTEYWALTLGIVLVLITLFLRGGIVGFLEGRFKVLFVRRD